MRNRGVWVAVLLTYAGACAVACGGSKDSVRPATANELTVAQIDADPIALLPGSAILIASVDAHAFYTSGSVGAQLSALSEQLIPIGDEAGFRASRDVDRVVAGTYSMEGIDVTAVLSGRFDADKIARAAESHTPSHGGGLIVASRYAGRDVYTVNNVGFSILSPKTALVGTETGIRRALDRVHDGSAKREVTPWMLDTIETPGAEAAIAGDFATQPIASASIGAVNLSFLKGMKALRVLADFKPPGMHIAGTLTYTEAGQASAAGDNLKQLAGMANLVAITGLTPRLQDLTVKTVDADVQCSFSIDDQAMRKLLGAVPMLLQ